MILGQKTAMAMQQNKFSADHCVVLKQCFDFVFKKYNFDRKRNQRNVNDVVWVAQNNDTGCLHEQSQVTISTFNCTFSIQIKLKRTFLMMTTVGNT